MNSLGRKIYRIQWLTDGVDEKEVVPNSYVLDLKNILGNIGGVGLAGLDRFCFYQVTFLDWTSVTGF